MEEELKPDLCVIGAGFGGLAVATAAAQLGVAVVLVEKSRMGGTALNFGDIPSKALRAAARRASAIRGAARFGVDVLEAKIEPRRVHDHVHGVIAAIAPNHSVERLTGLGIRVIQAEASFVDRTTLQAGDVLIRAKRFVIATGSSPVSPAISGIGETPYLTPETLFDIGERIQHLIILGGGAAALELAEAYCLLGSEVTVIDAGSFLPGEDPEGVRLILDHLQAAGVALRATTHVDSVEPSVQGVAVHVSGTAGTEIVKGSHLLIAGERKPNLASLGLERAKIKHDANGIKVNEQLTTSNSRVYAIGDVAGGAQSTHRAAFQARIVIRNALFRLKPKASAAVIPRVVYTDPELAQVGLLEAEARKRHRKIRILRWPYAENDRAQAERKTQGFIKVITARNGTILGCTIVGAAAGELIQLWVMAIAKAMRISEISSLVLPYPTLSELSKRVGFGYYGPVLAKSGLRSFIELLRRLG